MTDTRDTDGLADLVSGFGNKLGRRAELIAEREFTAGSVDLLGRIVEAAEARSRARDIHSGAERRTRTLARRLSARGAKERVRASTTSPSGSPPPRTPSRTPRRPGSAAR